MQRLRAAVAEVSWFLYAAKEVVWWICSTLQELLENKKRREETQMSIEQQLLCVIPRMKPVHFAGLAKLLGVDLVRPATENDIDYTSTAAEPSSGPKQVPRAFADVLEDVMARYSALSRGRKREILKLVKKSCQ